MTSFVGPFATSLLQFWTYFVKLINEELKVHAGKEKSGMEWEILVQIAI
jgi:hypothetical protein